MKKETVICIILAAVTLAVCTAGYFILPDTVIIQIGLDGKPGNTAPKLIALAVPLAFNLAGILCCRLKKEKKFILFSAIGVLVGVITILINR